MGVSNTITAEQDAPPTGLVLYGSRYNPIVVLLYKVELSQSYIPHVTLKSLKKKRMCL